MYKQFLVSAIVLMLALPAMAQDYLSTVFEQSGGTRTATYEEGIAWYQRLAEKYPEAVAMQEMGLTDSGQPLHLVTWNAQGKSFDALHAEGKLVVLINNAIHPGEPDGIEASMILLRDLVEHKQPAGIENLVVCVIPFYNIGGVLNRNSTTRVNQEGPEEYGFRGNARNYDLNRDFIKADTRNAAAFAEIYHKVNPDVFLDTHVSNGADYQHTLTLLTTQHNKLGYGLGKFLDETMEPYLFQEMASQGDPITPYVNVWGSVPDSGWVQFYDGARYSTGYTALFGTLGFMTETHMLKPFKQRTESTLRFMEVLLLFGIDHREEIKTLRQQWYNEVSADAKEVLTWYPDEEEGFLFPFHGYEAQMVASKVTGMQRLYYDRSKPYVKEVPHFKYWYPEQEVTKPKAYLVPQQWQRVIERLRMNGVVMTQVTEDGPMEVEVYVVESYETRNSPYEGHFSHSNVQVRADKRTVNARKGDYIVTLGQRADRYILQVLEPRTPDSFFHWNFFDTILQQKEGFSPYVFEEIAEELLANDPGLKAEFEAALQSNERFARNWYAQLDFIYKRSPYYEPAHLRYPICRIMP